LFEGVRKEVSLLFGAGRVLSSAQFGGFFWFLSVEAALLPCPQESHSDTADWLGSLRIDRL